MLGKTTVGSQVYAGCNKKTKHLVFASRAWYAGVG